MFVFLSVIPSLIVRNTIDAIIKNKYISTVELSEPMVQRHLYSLINKVYIRRAGSRKTEVLRK